MLSGASRTQMSTTYFVAQPGAGEVRVLRVLFEGVLGREHGGHAALGPVGRRVVALALGDEQHLTELGGAQREGEARDAAAENQEVGAECH